MHFRSIFFVACACVYEWVCECVPFFVRMRLSMCRQKMHKPALLYASRKGTHAENNTQKIPYTYIPGKNLNIGAELIPRIKRLNANASEYGAPKGTIHPGHMRTSLCLSFYPFLYLFYCRTTTGFTNNGGQGAHESRNNHSAVPLPCLCAAPPWSPVLPRTTGRCVVAVLVPGVG